MVDVVSKFRGAVTMLEGAITAMLDAGAFTLGAVTAVVGAVTALVGAVTMVEGSSVTKLAINTGAVFVPAALRPKIKFTYHRRHATLIFSISQSKISFVV